MNDVTTNAVRELRRSTAALLLELPEAVWREHKGYVENAIAQLDGDLRAALAERDAARRMQDA